MISESPYEKLLQECLKGELRVLNAHVPSRQKPLSDLLGEEYPHVVCSDGSPHLFKRKELEYLVRTVEPEEQSVLFLPMLIELGSSQDEVAVICRGGIEEKILTKILNMPVTEKQGRITLYKPQLSVLRKILKTTTQYIYSTKALV